MLRSLFFKIVQYYARIKGYSNLNCLSDKPYDLAAYTPSFPTLPLSLSHSFPIYAVQRLDFIWQFIAEDICGYVAKKMEIEMREDLKCVVEESVRDRRGWVGKQRQSLLGTGACIWQMYLLII